MWINDKDFNHFHMKVNSFSFQPMDASITMFQPEKSIYPIIGATTLTPKKMKFVAEFRDKLDISNFISEILNHKENVINIDDGFLYHCYYSGDSSVSEYWNGWYRLTVSFMTIQTGFMVKQRLKNGQNRLTVKGNWETECIYEIDPLSDQAEITIDGIKIKNLKKGIVLYLDGIAKKVYTDVDQNRYSDCILPKNRFPVLRAGTVTIEIKGNVNVLLKYYPIYV